MFIYLVKLSLEAISVTISLTINLEKNTMGVLEARPGLKATPSMSKSHSTKKSNSKVRGDYSASVVTKESSTSSGGNQPSLFVYRKISQMSKEELKNA